MLDLYKKIGAVSIESIAVGPFVADQYWTQVVAETPDQVDCALVIPAGAEINLSLARLHPFLEERIAAVFPLSMVHAHSHALMDSQASLNLSAENRHLADRYALGKTLRCNPGWIVWLDGFQKPCVCSGGMIAQWKPAPFGRSVDAVSDEAFVDDSHVAPLSTPPEHCPKT